MATLTEKPMDSESKHPDSATSSSPKPESERPDDKVVLKLNNVHKTYLLGVEGVPALRYV